MRVHGYHVHVYHNTCTLYTVICKLLVTSWTLENSNLTNQIYLQLHHRTCRVTIMRASDWMKGSKCDKQLANHIINVYTLHLASIVPLVNSSKG